MADRVENSDDENSSVEAKEPWRKKIRVNRTRLLSDIDPIPLLDRMEEEGFADRIKLRDIREKNDTTEKNSEILNLVRTKGYKGFKRFCRLLKKSGNDGPATLLWKGEEGNLSEDEADDINQKPVRKINDLQTSLVSLYKTIGWENPCQAMMEEDWDIYVPPEIKVKEEKSEEGKMKEIYTRKSEADVRSFRAGENGIFRERSTTLSGALKSVKDLFTCSQPEICKNIYLTGDAGSGKSTLCKRIVKAWCDAMQDTHDDTNSAMQDTHDGANKEDIKFMSYFKYVFYIQLRDTVKFHINDIIKEQLLQGQSTDIKAILEKEKCLIILDGLDEWSAPSDAPKTRYVNKHIPGRDPIYTNTTFLTTSRSWKVDMINLNSKHKDKEVELCGIGKDSSKSLADSLLKHLDRKKNKETETNVDEFFDHIKERKLHDLCSVPLLLILMVTLWHHHKETGKSQVQLFSGMVNLLFERAVEKLDKKPETADGESKLSNCFTDQKHCKDHPSLLLSYAELAFKALFNKQKERTLVISDSMMETFRMSPSVIQQMLEFGILSKNKDLENYEKKQSTYSFLHTKVQEFLAALHIAISGPVIVNELKTSCDKLDIMTRMYQVWLFLSGMKGDLANQIIAHLADCINVDKRVLEYRNNGDLYDSRNCETIKDLQSYIVNCISESEKSGQKLENVTLPDLFIDDDKLSDVGHFVPHTDISVKSTYLCAINLTPDKVTTVTDHLKKCSSLEKLVVFDSYPQVKIPGEAIAKIAETSRDTLTWIRMSFVKLSKNIIPSRMNCTVVRLLYCKALHDVYEETLDILSKMSSIKQLVVDIECTDYDQPESKSGTAHDRQCRPMLDVSVWPQLEKLELHCMTVKGLESVADHLEEIILNDVTIATDLCDFVGKLSKTTRPVTVKLVQVEVTSPTEKLKDVFDNRPQLTEPDCRQDDIYNKWDISFKINNASSSGSRGTVQSDEA